MEFAVDFDVENSLKGLKHSIVLNIFLLNFACLNTKKKFPARAFLSSAYVLMVIDAGFVGQPDE